MAEAEIRIATAGPMTGPAAWIGEQYLRAAEMAVEDLNSRGGVLGQSNSSWEMTSATAIRASRSPAN
jgi:ABC-type branched-subunit amino acid transport system substrate-binding protein